MKIDLEGTRKRFQETGRSFGGWARTVGLDVPRMNHLMLGNVKFRKHELDLLARDGLLVLLSDDEDKAA